MKHLFDKQRYTISVMIDQGHKQKKLKKRLRKMNQPWTKPQLRQ